MRKFILLSCLLACRGSPPANDEGNLGSEHTPTLTGLSLTSDKPNATCGEPITVTATVSGDDAAVVTLSAVGATLSSSSLTGSGSAIVTCTQSGGVTVTASAGTLTASVGLTFAIGPPDASKTQLILGRDRAIADGRDYVTATVSSFDAFGNVSGGLAVSVGVAGAAPTGGTTNSEGHFLAQLSSTTVGDTQIIATAGSTSVSQPVHFTNAWVNANGDQPGSLVDFAVDGADTLLVNRIFYSQSGAIYLAHDGMPVESWGVGGPTSFDQFAALGAGNGCFYYAELNTNVYGRCLDEPAWHLLNTFSDNIFGMDVYGDTLYVATGTGSSEPSVHQYSSGGAWSSSVGTGLPTGDSSRLIIAPVGPTMYAVNQSGVFVRAPSGSAWSASAGAPLKGHAVAVDSSTTPPTLYVQTAGDMYRYRDTWEMVGAGLPTGETCSGFPVSSCAEARPELESLVIDDSTTPPHLFIHARALNTSSFGPIPFPASVTVRHQGLFSATGGTGAIVWTKVSDTLPSTFKGGSGTLVFSALRGIAKYSTQNLTKTFEAHTSGLPAYGAALAGRGNKLFALVSGEMYASDDKGATWADVGLLGANFSASALACFGDHTLLAAGIVPYAIFLPIPQPRLAWSTDDGAHWSTTDSTATLQSIFTSADHAAALSGNLVYLFGASGWQADGASGATSDIQAIALSNDAIYAANASSIWTHTFLGDTWTQVGETHAPLGVRALSVHPTTGEFWLGDDEGLFRMPTGATGFTAVDGFDPRPVYSIQVDPVSNALWISSDSLLDTVASVSVISADATVVVPFTLGIEDVPQQLGVGADAAFAATAAQGALRAVDYGHPFRAP